MSDRLLSSVSPGVLPELFIIVASRALCFFFNTEVQEDLL
jgi:hypothetical protein